jgi:hypothetical protein
VVLGWLALLALLLVIGQLTRWPWLHPLTLVAYALTVLPFVAVWALGCVGLHRGVGVGPLLVGLGLWAVVCFGLDSGPLLLVAALALLPGVAALVTHPRRRAQVGSAAR